MIEMFSGWWDQVRMRPGWSNKIGKWQWVALQAIIPLLVTLPLLIWITTKFEGYTLTHALTFLFIFFPLTAISFSGRWNKDQNEVSDKRDIS